MSTNMSFIASLIIKNTNILTLKIATREFPKSAFSFQIVRWRKPRYVPVTASKQFYVPKPHVYDPEELKILAKRLNRYNTSMKAVRSFLVQSYATDTKRRHEDESQQTEEKDEFDKMMDDNDKWNAKVAEIRELRQAKDNQLHQEQSDERLAVATMFREQREDKARAILLRDIEDSEHFITEDKLEKSIEKLMDKTQDYNYAVDKDGEKVTGITHIPVTHVYEDEDFEDSEDGDKPV